MSDDTAAPPRGPAEEGEAVLDTARANIRRLNEFQDEEDASLSGLQRGIEAVSRFFGSSKYFVFVAVFIAGWIAVNELGSQLGWSHVDEFPYFGLQGLVSANALLLTVSVLIRQNRMAQQATRRAHLDLHVNLLTEQKVSKVLEAVSALSQRLGEPATGEDVEELAEAADPKAILTAIKESEENEHTRAGPA